MSKVLIVIGDATECLDTYYPYFRLQEDDYQPVVAGPDKRLYQLVLHERPPGWDITRETAGYHMQADIAFRDVKPEDYVGLFLSGGRAPEYIRYDVDLLNITQHFFKNNLPVASVCHGIEIPAAANCLQGRKVTTVSKCELDATMMGATYVDEPCVVDGNLISARTWHDNAPFMKAFIKLLNSRRK
ncbi:MAG: DJ-1/PfpI family protein [Planctomycetota bacterium]|jgi:protease I|nr:DJ-1/PfpI family protein [Planctomycetota bacterium]MDA1211651.1 DJ-1/PfpI family protein [Planctomycetota bacterium]